MPRELGGRVTRPGRREIWSRGQHFGDASVQPCPFRRKDRLVHGLALERVPEAVPAVGVGREHVKGQGFAEDAVERVVVERTRGPDQSMVDGAAGNGGHDDRTAGCRREPIDPQHDDVSQRVRQRPRISRGRQLLREERVPAAASVHGVEQRPIRRFAEDAAHEHTRRVAGEARELELVDVAMTRVSSATSRASA